MEKLSLSNLKIQVFTITTSFLVGLVPLSLSSNNSQSAAVVLPSISDIIVTKAPSFSRALKQAKNVNELATLWLEKVKVPGSRVEDRKRLAIELAKQIQEFLDSSKFSFSDLKTNITRQQKLLENLGSEQNPNFTQLNIDVLNVVKEMQNFNSLNYTPNITKINTEDSTELTYELCMLVIISIITIRSLGIRQVVKSKKKSITTEVVKNQKQNNTDEADSPISHEPPEIPVLTRNEVSLKKRAS